MFLPVAMAKANKKQQQQQPTQKCKTKRKRYENENICKSLRLANAQQQKDWNEEMCFRWQQKIKTTTIAEQQTCTHRQTHIIHKEDGKKIDEVNDKRRAKDGKNGHLSKYHCMCARLFYVYINKSHLSKQAPLPIIFHSAFFIRTFIFSRYLILSPNASLLFLYIYISFSCFFFVFVSLLYISRTTDFSPCSSSQQCQLWWE